MLVPVYAWTADDIEALISEAEVRPAVWNVFAPEHSDCVKKKHCLRGSCEGIAKRAKSS